MPEWTQGEQAFAKKLQASAGLEPSGLKLAHTPLKGIQWINLAHANLQFVTITR